MKSMMRNQTRWTVPAGVLMTLGLLIAADQAWSQPGAGLDGRGSLIRTFESNAPAVGALMPNLPVYDREGEESNLLELLDGRYTVLVLGCLT